MFNSSDMILSASAFWVFLWLFNTPGLKSEETNYTGSYVILAPRLLRPNLPYSVAVNFLESREPVVVRVRVIDAQNHSIAQSWGHDIQEGHLSLIKIEKIPSNLSPDVQYKLFVQGETVSGRILFQKSANLEYVQKSRSIFVQTDRGIYKPGSEVHIRVIVVTPDLKPYNGVANITIMDPNGNVIKQHRNALIESGVCGRNDALKMTLNKEPPLGDWQIIVNVDGQDVTEEFSVDKYVLPTFEVEVKPPPFATVNSDITVFVRAKYTYGKSVEGNVTISAHYPWPYYANEETQEMTKTAELDYSGEASFQFTNKDLRQRRLINEFGYNQIKFTAVVTERLTGQARNNSVILTVHKHPVKLVLTRGGDYFKSGLNYTFMVAIRSQDDQPTSPGDTKKIYLNADFTLKSLEKSNRTDLFADNETTVLSVPKRVKFFQTYELDSTGSTVITLDTPPSALAMRLEVRYGAEDSSIYAYDYIDSTRSPSNSYVQLSLTQDRIRPGDLVTFNVHTSSPIGTLVALVLSKGTVVHLSKIEMTENHGTVEFGATSFMAPKARLVVYGVLPDTKEIIVDAMDMKIEGIYNTGLNLSLSSSKAEPNTNITFSLSAPPSSFIGLLVVDQSALLLKSANNIDTSLIENELISYGTSSFGGYVMGQALERRRKRSLGCGGFDGSGRDAYTIFQTSGLIAFTDAFLYRELIPRVMYRLSKPYANYEAGEARMEEAAASRLPPLPMAGQRSPLPAVRIRSRFPETWIWSDLNSDEQGQASLTVPAPDTITSWVASAFSISEDAGLRVTPNEVKLQVFRPFFIRLNIPYSVKRDETVGLQVLIFNYLNEEKIVTVVLNHPSDADFELVLINEKFDKKKGKATSGNTKIIKVRSKSSATVYFPIRPKKIGITKLLVKAHTEDAADAVEVPLIVEAEGFPVYFSQSFILDLKKKFTLSQSTSIQPLLDVVEGSGRAEVTLIGDVMGPALSNIKQLIRMPFGCGEQNMINFVPNVIIIRYLTAVNLLTPELKSKLIEYTESGYQRELTYQRDDSSYSAFGKSDPQGSTWLTAFVVRSFAQAKPYIFIDEEKLNSSLEFLESQQKENGMFEDNGDVLHQGLQGGSGQGGVPLTAYVYLALLENGVRNSEAMNFLEQSLSYISNNAYSLSLVSYTLHRANSSKKDVAFRLLEAMATEKDGFKLWTANVSMDAKDKMNGWYEQAPPADVETTAYALLTYLLRNASSEAYPIVRWLVSKRDALGGFSSTQDTVVALQALATYAELTYTPDISMMVTVRNGDHKSTFQVNKDNLLVLQTYEVPRMEEWIELIAEGKGTAFAQVSWRYNVMELPNSQPFVCEEKVIQQAFNNLQLSLCCRYNMAGKSNMAVLEMQTPSGFVFNQDQLNSLTSKEYLQRVETEKQNTQANFYFNSLGSDPLCFNVSSQLSYQVTDQKPAIVRLYDYYEPSRRIEFDYRVQKQVVIDDTCVGDCSNEVTSAALTSGCSLAYRFNVVSVACVFLIYCMSTLWVRSIP